MPRWASSLGVLVGVYVAVMLAAALWMPHEWDWAVFNWLSSHGTPAFSEQVSIVDVQWDPSDIPGNRRRLAALLAGIVASKQEPKAVILDVEFDPCQSRPCGEPMESARDGLVASIRAAAERFPVYATEELPVDRDDSPAGPVDPQDAQIYGALTGAAQTHFTPVGQAGGLFYRVCYSQVPFDDETGNVVGTENVWSMVDRVLMPAGFVATAPCDASHVAVRLGPKLSPAAPNFYTVTDKHTFPGAAQFDTKYVIVGTSEYDRSPFTDRSGPEILGWTLSNALDRASPVAVQTYYDTQPPNGMLLLLAPVFSGIAVLAYTALFFLLKRLRLRALRYLLPWISAGLAAVLGLAVFAAFESWLLYSRDIQPQVSFISLGIGLASILSGFRGFQAIADEENAIDPTPTEKYDYDVFISYAHEEGAWVSENVYRPLRDATLPNGKKLSIFFDTSSIRSGTAWQDTLSLSIDASRFVVPVYSDIYFKKPYCRFEIKRAHRKWIAAGEQSRCVLPIMRGHPNIDATVDDIQALSIDDHPDLVQRVVTEIVENVARTDAGQTQAPTPAAS